MDKKTVGILTVATNHYIDYWHKLALSVEKNFDPTYWDTTLHVFTSEIDKAQQIARNLHNCKVQVHQIPQYGWPEATLYRYRIFQQFGDSLDEELLMHLDADMLVFRDIREELPINFKNDICLVLHPGYYRPKGFKLVWFYSTHPKVFISDIRMKSKVGALGSWENREEYLAYVPRSARKNYVCGGTWFGKNLAFKRLLDELAVIEMRDTSKNLIPVWHDESILNKWSSQNHPTLLSPSYCYDPTYPQLFGLPEYIRAVDKGSI